MSMLGGRSLIPTNYYFWGRGGVRGGATSYIHSTNKSSTSQGRTEHSTEHVIVHVRYIYAQNCLGGGAL